MAEFESCRDPNCSLSKKKHAHRKGYAEMRFHEAIIALDKSLIKLTKDIAATQKQWTVLQKAYFQFMDKKEITNDSV